VDPAPPFVAEGGVLRKIIEIDDARCDGCGDCIPSCAEGALAVVNGKVRLVRDLLCDGLGACLGTCEKGALRVVEREAEAFDEAAVHAHLATRERHAPPAAGCPGSQPVELAPRRRGLSVLPGEAPTPPARTAVNGSRLSQWPVQLHLVSPGAPYFQDADLLVAADCVPFAYARFHDDFLAGKRLVVGCPKLDDVQAYVGKLTDILGRGTIRSVTVVKMVVPCCGGIAAAVRTALAASGKAIPYREITVGVEGGVVS
jgi:NAD-dependent dihydropyrimidine dehydrogenase PreA subunit